MTAPLISADELLDLVSAHPPHVTVLDVRWRLGGPPGHELYLGGHVPGARYVDLDTDLASPPGAGGRHPLPDAGHFETAMRRAGVCDGRPVVVYDDWSSNAAARCWWLLRHHGHDDVRVLDGAWPAWLDAGGDVETGEPVGEVEVGDFGVRPGALPVVDADEVARLAAGDGVVVDARAPERYRGETEPVDPVAGHVPGAVNVPTADNLRDDGRFVDAAALTGRYGAVGAVPGADVAVYCGSGITACHDVLALEAAGVRAALYPGSWSEWVDDPNRPVATGPLPAD